MSCAEVEILEGKEKDPLLGLDDGWKEWLRPTHATESSNDRVDIKNELKNEEENRSVGIQDEDCVNVKEERTDENLKPSVNKTVEISQYNTVTFKSYTSNIAKEIPLEDISSIFKENDLLYEKKRYHQKIFNEIFTEMESLEVLQTQYIEYLRNAVDLETFNCSKCGYQTIHKSNMQSHFFLIHKTEMESTMYQCATKFCKYKTKNMTYLEKHVLTHDGSYSDLETPIENEWRSEKERKKNKRRQGSSKTDSKTEEYLLLCDFCPFKGENKESIKKHLETHKCPANPNRNLCYLCDYGVIDKIYLQKHLFKVHGVATKGVHKFVERKCDYCHYTTDSKECYNVHMMQHKKPDEIIWFKCSTCDFKTKHRASFRYHMRNHNVPEDHLRRFMCEICSKKFKSTNSFKLHLARHKTASEDSEIFKCSKCEFQTKMKLSLTQHIKIHRDPTHVCNICGHRTRRKGNFELHLLQHKSETEVNMFECSICTYSTKFKAYFKRHLEKGLHLGKKDKNKNSDEAHTCEVCGRKLSSAGALKTHSKKHKNPDEVEMFKCEQCPYESKFKSQLAMHRKKHRPPEFKCEICGLQSRTKWNYKMHALTHKSTAECELFSCGVCSYQTKFKPYLREHLKKRHNILTGEGPGRKSGPRKKKESV